MWRNMYHSPRMLVWTAAITSTGQGSRTKSRTMLSYFVSTIHTYCQCSHPWLERTSVLHPWFILRLGTIIDAHGWYNRSSFPAPEVRMLTTWRQSSWLFMTSTSEVPWVPYNTDDWFTRYLLATAHLISVICQSQLAVILLRKLSKGPTCREIWSFC